MAKNITKLFICCPLSRNNYAGWLFQIKRYAERNQSKADIHFIFSRGTQGKSELANAWRFARHARNYIRDSLGDRIALFPSFFFPNMLVALILPQSIPYVVRISGGELTIGNPLVFRLRIALLRRARAVIILNTDACEKLARLRIKSAVLVPNTVSDAFRPPTEQERLEAKRSFGLSTDAVVVGHVGTICKRKQQFLIVSAAARSGTEKVEVLLCGPHSGHPEADSDYFNHCRRFVEREGLRMVTTGRLSDTIKAYWAMDIFAFPSLSEGMPNALLEAMACGLPCIATDIPGSRDIIQAGKSGILVPLKSTEEFNYRLTKLIEDGDARAMLSDAAQTRTRSDFSPAAMDDAYNKIFGLTK